MAIDERGARVQGGDRWGWESDQNGFSRCNCAVPQCRTASLSPPPPPRAGYRLNRPKTSPVAERRKYDDGVPGHIGLEPRLTVDELERRERAAKKPRNRSRPYVGRPTSGRSSYQRQTPVHTYAGPRAAGRKDDLA